jgi:hypothetical protein
MTAPGTKSATPALSVAHTRASLKACVDPGLTSDLLVARSATRGTFGEPHGEHGRGLLGQRGDPLVAGLPVVVTCAGAEVDVAAAKTAQL